MSGRLSLGDRSSITKSGQSGADRDRSASLSAFQRGHETQAASAARIEPSGSVKPPLESNAIPRPSFSAHSSRRRVILLFILLVLLPAGVITRISPTTTRTTHTTTNTTLKRINTTTHNNNTDQKRSGSGISRRAKFISE